MTLMCIERSQSPTHKGSFLQGRKSPENNNNNINQQNANNQRRNSCSPPLSKNQQDVPNAIKSVNQESRKLERSASEPDRRAVQSNSSRYKTELCRPFEENGTCKYGDKCQFAHGQKELRNMARHPKYKTELCRTFHSTGLCPYGPRCHFIHNSEQSKKSLLTNLASTVTPAPALTRPKALTSLGSAGDVSPVSSHGGTPTCLKSFEDMFQLNSLSPTFDNGYSYTSSDLVKSVALLQSFNHQLNDCIPRDFCSDVIESGNVIGDGSPYALDYCDNYSYHAGSVQPVSVTPTAADGNFFRLPIFNRFHIKN